LTLLPLPSERGTATPKDPDPFAASPDLEPVPLSPFFPSIFCPHLPLFLYMPFPLLGWFLYGSSRVDISRSRFLSSPLPGLLFSTESCNLVFCRRPFMFTGARLTPPFDHGAPFVCKVQPIFAGFSAFRLFAFSAS